MYHKYHMEYEKVVISEKNVSHFTGFPYHKIAQQILQNSSLYHKESGQHTDADGWSHTQRWFLP